jgi:hypothetical protein
MAFKGIFPAPKLTPMEFGLFSAAKPEITGASDVDERWVRGFEVDLESRPNYVRSWSENSATSDVAFSDPSAPRYLEIKPWFIEVEDHATTMGMLGLNRFERVLRQLEAVTQKTMEREFWEGNIARGESIPNTFLSNSATVTILNGGLPVPPHHAIAYLEKGIANQSAAGEQGVLHMTRDVATLLGSQYMLTRVEDDPGHIHIETNGGTTVVLGAGYSGNGKHTPISSVSLTSNVATVNTNGAHVLEIGDRVEITGVNAVFNGTFTVTGTPDGDTFTYALTHANVSSTNVTSGWAQMQATSDKKWIYATGTVGIYLGNSDVVNDNLAQAYDVANNNNDMRIKATRPVAAYFDTSIHLAVKVDMSTSAI